MTLGRYAVSVMWGKGRHYFLAADYENEVQALDAAFNHEQKLMAAYKKRRHKGAEPRCYVWKRCVS